MRDAVIVAAVRSPMGRALKGNYVWTRIDDLAAEVVTKALAKIPNLDPNLVEDLILGCAMPEGEQGMNLARNVAFLAKLPLTVGSVTVNRFCASSLEAINTAALNIMVGNGDVIIAAGAESMSHVPMGGFNPSLNPLLMQKGMPDAYISMGITAENLAEKHKINGEEQNKYAANSHIKALKAMKEGLFTEIVEVTVKKQDGSTALVSIDEGPREPDLAKLAALKPVFREGGSVTAGNSSPLTDGAAAVILMSATKAKELGIKPLVKIRAMAVAGCAPETMGEGPAYAVPKALKRAGLSLKDVDIFEFNEAFAVQTMSVSKMLGLDYYDPRINPKGGALALGHPLGCTGARIMSTLVQDLIGYNKNIGLESMCIGGGQGLATIVERLN
ncbi:MAG: acetyl-CoA acetyltransferase [Deltaproteobacteria bacterium RIFCSPLOWO2_12_FULL_40_28]|nr:MAG: acetyl-CoA acetyltransferase [Deltaproteobacteria bacterium RIFCSPHIGHO2_02_FULL_40_28]OGQ20644.1 MAG: acetyl-CoA acetyltransferase [Deltaproteobacteria bacterium RIFCSPHIGHO2_12_FULL_40_32]OGQ38879.1 MAG: acetyl-CoA acetyltransferase [Deltaproteobacteria bacterium RIFCSPLOWO2_02_FULL_40_36]OGQ55238.1 MAG: acetyl-CoA acetyltransferase [Deltaproteobacteria bacterium RIFCSPLOWO2_12_FULL_40_28]